MKRICLCLFMLLFSMGAMAQTEVQPIKPSRWDKEPSKFIFGVSYRFSLGLVEHVAVKMEGMPKISENRVPDNMKGGALLVSLGANIAKNWSAVAELGVAMYAGQTFGQVGAKVQYFYGHKQNRWFNYANVDGLVALGSVSFLGGVGGGYRIKLGRRPCVDFSVGYELIRASRAAYNYSAYGPPEDLSVLSATITGVRHGLVFGVGFVF